MSNSDKEKLKAELEDGYGRIANLLLEALSASNLNGKQMSICLFIMRRTYSWNEKSDEITLKEFATACNSSETYMSKQLKQLIKWKVIKRKNYSPGRVPEYEINTRVDEWDKGCLNVQGLNKSIRQGLYKKTRVPLNKRTRVVMPSDVENAKLEGPPKESIKEILKKDTITTIESALEENPHNFTAKDIGADPIQQKEESVARVDADSTKQFGPVSIIETFYLQNVRKKNMCSSNDMIEMLKVYETYKDLDFILEVMRTATEDNIKRNGKCKINSFNYFTPIFEEKWEERWIKKGVGEVEPIRTNSSKSNEYDLSEFLYQG